ncbi:hypothetical protein QBZ16_004622 [Prototheca wickerhamii]|uniref:Tyrosine decarboxylase n=1 Tax=Prototheca wickerhamii TaxID=3111 RepID=A0AAD9MH05_PROWI|nr:hypothetical protein QBZ16_004622 [Prototheca wickerhamii]
MRFRRLGYSMVDAIVDYRQTLEKYPVRSEVASGYLAKRLPDQAPETPETMEEIMADVQEHIMPGMTHWQHPNFYAWYPANSSYPAMLGDMLSSALGIIGFSWNGSPAATELETVVLDWFARFLNLPDCFLSSGGSGGGGVIQGSASEACLVALLAARTRALKQRGAAPGSLVAYATDQSHSCVKKACMIAGVEHLRLVETRGADGWALDPATLEAAMTADEAAGLHPFFLNTLIGTTSTAAVDPVADVAAVAARHGAWTHVDAAYAGVFACLPEQHAQHFQGLEAADSIATNAHKGMLVTFDCCALWVKDSFWLRSALSLEPQYQFAGLRHEEEHLDYKDWQVPLGRRFRALKLWFVLRLYGAEKIRAYLQHHLDTAAALVELVKRDDRFELAAPPRFGLVCFRLRGASDEESRAFLERINRSGKAFLVHTVVGGRHTIRCAIGGVQTQWRHVESTWRLIQQLAEEKEA